MTRVSVIVPVYDVGPYLEACVDSVLAQTHHDVEVVLVDDGAVDGSEDRCDTYGLAHENVLVELKENGGVSAARNAGLDTATGEYVHFLDGDDTMAEDTVANMLACAEETQAQVVVAGYYVDVRDEQENLVSSETRLPPRLRVDVGSHEPVPVSPELLNHVGYAWNKLYRRDVVTQARFAEGTSLVEDILFNAPVLASAARVEFLDKAFVHYIQRPRVTLGTRPYDDFAQLMHRASRSTALLLESWGVPRDSGEAVLRQVEADRVQWALRGIALGRATPVRTRLARMRFLLADSALRRVLREEGRFGTRGRARRLLLASQAHGCALPTLLAYGTKRGTG